MSEFDAPPPDGPCTFHCHHGWVEVYQDADGNYLGPDRWDESYAAIPVTQADGSTIVVDLVSKETTYPCPGHEPELFLRWQEGKLGSERSNRRAGP